MRKHSDAKRALFIMLYRQGLVYIKKTNSSVTKYTFANFKCQISFATHKRPLQTVSLLCRLCIIGLYYRFGNLYMSILSMMFDLYSWLCNKRVVKTTTRSFLVPETQIFFRVVNPIWFRSTFILASNFRKIGKNFKIEECHFIT